MLRLLQLTALLASGVAAIWPLPSSYTSGDSVLFIDPSVQITLNGGYTSTNSSRIITTAINETMNTLFNQQFVPWRFHPRFSDFEPSADSSSNTITSVTLVQTQADPSDVLKPLAGSVDESYTLSLTTEGQATITAASSLGLAHGLKTFTQLFYKSTSGSIYTQLAPVEIQDAPKFEHRGLNLDVARSWFEPKDIIRTIDALYYNKFNRLHLHVTDSQSWPLEVPALPDLAGKGAYGSAQSYSPETLAYIQDYASVRGIEVILEIDMPGHTASIWYGYPDLIAAFLEENWSTYAAEPPSGTLKLNSSAVTQFLDTLFDDVLPRVFPYSSYFHTGGDEINAMAYTLDDTVMSSDVSVITPLLQAFVDRAHDNVRAAGLIPLVWEELLLQWNLTLGDDVVVQCWQSSDAVVDTVSRGHKALTGIYEFWVSKKPLIRSNKSRELVTLQSHILTQKCAKQYLDCGKGQWIDFYPNVAAGYFPYQDYCAPVHNWRVMYDYDPLAGVPENLTHLVLGGEAHMWTEQVDGVALDRMVWPRTCAAGEVLWSGAKDENGQNRSQITASPRLADMRERLVAKGIMAEEIQMPFCTQNGTQCAL